MIDPLGLQQVEGFDDVGRGPLLAGMGDAMPAQLRAGLEDPLEA